MPNISPDRFVNLRELGGHTQQEMGNILGITAKYVGMLERGAKLVEENSSLGILFRFHEESALNSVKTDAVCDRGFPIRNNSAPRMISVLGWAHAGQAGSYEELPKDWQRQVPTECPDERAFAVKLEGDSMEPDFKDGDILVVQPSEAAYSGCFVVARFVNDGVIFRRMEMSGDQIILKPLNDRWPVTNHALNEFSWIYPVWGRWTQIWKKR